MKTIGSWSYKTVIIIKCKRFYFLLVVKIRYMFSLMLALSDETIFILDIFRNILFDYFIRFARVFTTVKVFFTTNTFGVCWHVLCHFHCHVNLPWDSLSYACDNVLHYSGQTCRIHSIHFLHSVIFIDWMYWDRRGPKIPGLSVCVCVCLCVCLSVCLCRAVSRNYWADFNKTLQK